MFSFSKGKANKVHVNYKHVTQHRQIQTTASIHYSVFYYHDVLAEFLRCGNGPIISTFDDGLLKTMKCCLLCVDTTNLHLKLEVWRAIDRKLVDLRVVQNPDCLLFDIIQKFNGTFLYSKFWKFFFQEKSIPFTKQFQRNLLKKIICFDKNYFFHRLKYICENVVEFHMRTHCSSKYKSLASINLSL